ncbi:N-acetylmuramoyl-L-alanine amidase [Peptoniphilus sp. MSJ-1]|uniref:N-acetylmuramoyl-L-alanine amidase n=1 Tax=Peptoniphilus ovalis TaxID=2841503 RepID=A0ABS6FHM1_9FIRM|nr:peptidoglycan recognition family protein [Peptoniphilus ovalis]MBU5669672.1 N-acetylmuramoyl-L-alanine amidase [Peptoniphilus ovalis]
MRFRYKPISNKRQIGKKRSYDSIKYIVIHDTGNPSRGANAEMHYRYLNNATRYGSAHYYLDDKEIIQTIGDSLVAWSIGDKWGYKNNPNRIVDAFNSNSISIELCVNSDIDKEKAYRNLVELTKNLMVKFKIPASRVIRHYDATGKSCPDSWKSNNWSKWKQFKEDIQKPIVAKIDLSKDSEFNFNDISNEVNNNMTETNKNNTPSDWAKKEWQEGIDLGITDGTRPKDTATREEVNSMIVRALKKN